MAVAYKSAGGGVATEASGGDLAPTCPATVDANDILIAHVAYEGTTTAPSTPSGWSLLGGPYTVESTVARHWIFGKLAAGTEDGAAISFGTPAVTTMRTGRIYSFSGWVAGTIRQISPAASYSHQSHATDPVMPTVTTTVVGSLAVACIYQADDNAQDSATGESGGDWTEAVAEYTQLATTPDSALGLQTCIPTANPGTVSGGGIATANDPCGVIGFELRPTNIKAFADTVALSSLTGSAKLTKVVPFADTLALTSLTSTPALSLGAVINFSDTLALTSLTSTPKLNKTVAFSDTLALDSLTSTPKLNKQVGFADTISLTSLTGDVKLTLSKNFADTLDLTSLTSTPILTVSTIKNFSDTLALTSLTSDAKLFKEVTFSDTLALTSLTSTADLFRSIDFSDTLALTSLTSDATLSLGTIYDFADTLALTSLTSTPILTVSTIKNFADILNLTSLTSTPKLFRLMEFGDTLVLTSLTNEPNLKIAGINNFSDILTLTSLTSSPHLTISITTEMYYWNAATSDWIQIDGF